MNIKFLLRLTATLVLMQVSTLGYAETSISNARKIADDRAAHHFKIQIYTATRDQTIEVATEKYTQAHKKAISKHATLLSESNDKANDLRNYRTKKRIWENAKKRRDRMYQSYDTALTLVNQATRKMNSERTCVFFCPNTQRYDVAVKVRARYWEYKSTIKTKYESLKDEVVPTTLAEETAKAVGYHAWHVQDKIRADSAWAFLFLSGLVLTSEYRENADSVAFKSKDEVAWADSVITYNADENKRTSEVTIGIILANGKDVADRLLQEDISDANAVMEDDTKDVKEALSDAIRYAAVVVEETLDSPWVTDQSTFNYRLDCALEDSLAVAVVFHGANHKDKLILDDSGLYKYPFDINASFPAMSKMCIPIVVPKSGINTLVADDGTIEVYRNWWMTTGEVDDTGIIVREEEEEINEFIELLKLAKEVAKKPVYIMYGNGYNDKDYEGDKETVIRVIDKLTKLNELDLIAGTLYSDIETGGFTMYTLDGDVISTHQGLNK